MFKTLALILIVAVVQAAEVWPRLEGIVKAVNVKAQTLTVQKREGDIVVLKLDKDVDLVGSTGPKLSDIKPGDKVAVFTMPRSGHRKVLITR